MLESLLLILMFALSLANIWGASHFFYVLSINDTIKPYVGLFRVKHLGLIFILPSYIVCLFVIYVLFLPFYIIDNFNIIKDFLNKPLFQKKEKKEVKTIGIVLDINEINQL